MADEIGRSYDTSERDERYELIRTDQENDPNQIHTDGKISQGEDFNNKIGRSDQNIDEPNKYGNVPSTKNLWIGLINKDCYKYPMIIRTKTQPAKIQKPAGFMPGDTTPHGSCNM